MIRLKYLIVLLVLFSSAKSGAQQPDKKSDLEFACVAFWNVENLYDTINDPNKDDEEFLPDGINKWNAKRYNEKLNRLAEVIAQLGNQFSVNGPAVLGLAEIENSLVLKDLAAQPRLKNCFYKFVHFEGPDVRGVDVALLYNSKRFKLTRATHYPLTIAKDTGFATREQLVVTGKLDQEEMTFIVAHWPSRRGGSDESNHKRVEAAKLGRRIVDSLQKKNKDALIIYMGDLNDDPADESVSKYMNSGFSKTIVSTGYLFNPMFELHKPGFGTLAYKENWNLFDQTLLSLPFVNSTGNTYKFQESHVFNAEFVREKEGKYKGQPFRTYAGKNYLGGYSDHFAVYTILVKQGKKKKIK